MCRYRRRRWGHALILALAFAAIVVLTHGWALVAMGVLMAIGAVSVIREHQHTDLTGNSPATRGVYTVKGSSEPEQR